MCCLSVAAASALTLKTALGMVTRLAHICELPTACADAVRSLYKGLCTFSDCFKNMSFGGTGTGTRNVGYSLLLGRLLGLLVVFGFIGSLCLVFLQVKPSPPVSHAVYKAVYPDRGALR